MNYYHLFQKLKGDGWKYWDDEDIALWGKIKTEFNQDRNL